MYFRRVVSKYRWFRSGISSPHLKTNLNGNIMILQNEIEFLILDTWYNLVVFEEKKFWRGWSFLFGGGGGGGGGVGLAWENSRHFVTPPTVSPRNDVWETSTEILYWWRVTTRILVALLIGWSKFTRPRPIIRSATQIWVVTRHHYGISVLVSPTSLVASRNVVCFVSLGWDNWLYACPLGYYQSSLGKLVIRLYWVCKWLGKADEIPKLLVEDFPRV